MKKRQFDYFDSFIECADYALQCARMLHEVVTNFNPATAAAKMDEIHTIEHMADKIKHKTTEHLVKEFLPPIEREDIMSLSHELDNVVDGIDEVMRRIVMFRIQTLKPETVQFSQLLIQCCEALKDLVLEFKSFKKSSKIKDAIIRVNSLESEGDVLHFESVSKLYQNPQDPLQIMIWKNLFDCFEECYDSFEYTSDLIETVVLKNS